MDKMTVNIGGKDYPCRFTMGAMLLFKRNMGKDVSQMQQDDIEELLMLMWCCIKCACKAEGVGFDMDFETFTCSVTPQDLAAWNEAINAGNEKKKDKSGA